jgi:hypothetical protein
MTGKNASNVLEQVEETKLELSSRLEKISAQI